MGETIILVEDLAEGSHVWVGKEDGKLVLRIRHINYPPVEEVIQVIDPIHIHFKSGCKID